MFIWYCTCTYYHKSIGLINDTPMLSQSFKLINIRYRIYSPGECKQGIAMLHNLLGQMPHLLW